MYIVSGSNNGDGGDGNNGLVMEVEIMATVAIVEFIRDDICLIAILDVLHLNTSCLSVWLVHSSTKKQKSPSYI